MSKWERCQDNAAVRQELAEALLVKHRPRRSISAGHDCGDLRRAGLTELPWLAQMALNTGRTYMTVVKISGATGGKGEMKTLRGHCISFPQPLAPQCTAGIAAQVRLPRTDMHQYMSFVKPL